MPNQLEELELREVSLVDAPANSSTDPRTGRKRPHANVALFKRDGCVDMDEFEKAVHGRTQGGTAYPKGDYAYAPDDVPSHWKLRLTASPGGKPDAGIVGAAVAALGGGFRGNKVAIPRADRPAVVARVRSAWKLANPDKGGEELPEILKGATHKMPMTLEQLETEFTKVSGTVSILKGENDLLKAERELVIKMSKKQRKAYASMTPAMQKEFMAGDEQKRKSMCDGAMKTLKEKALEDSMDDAVKAEYAKAGPSERITLLAKQRDLVDKAADDEMGADAKAKRKAAKKPSDDEADDDEPDDDPDDKNLELKRKLAKADDKIAALEGTVLSIAKHNRLESFVKRAEAELPNTPGSPVEKGQLLMQMADALPGGESGDLFKRYVSDMKAADAALRTSFGEVGKAAGEVPAEKAFMAKAEEIAKRDKISQGNAVAKAMDEFPELYMDYERQHNGAIGKARGY